MMCYIISNGIKQGCANYFIFDLYPKDFILPLFIQNSIYVNEAVRIFLP